MNFVTWLFKAVVCIVLIFSGFYLYSRFGIGIPLVSVFSHSAHWMVVSGEGKVSLVPDTGLVNIGAGSVHKEVQKAQEEANRIMNSVVGALKQIGIEEKDIKTNSYSIFPSYDWSAKRRFLGYQADIELSVTVRSLDKVDEVIDVATAKGANTVGEVRLIASEEKERVYRQKARELAVNAAKEKAGQLSQAAGISLGRLVKVEEDDSEAPPAFYALEQANKPTASSETHIVRGVTDITSRVKLFYETR